MKFEAGFSLKNIKLLALGHGKREWIEFTMQMYLLR